MNIAKKKSKGLERDDGEWWRQDIYENVFGEKLAEHRLQKLSDHVDCDSSDDEVGTLVTGYVGPRPGGVGRIVSKIGSEVFKDKAIASSDTHDGQHLNQVHRGAGKLLHAAAGSTTKCAKPADVSAPEGIDAPTADEAKVAEQKLKEAAAAAKRRKLQKNESDASSFDFTGGMLKSKVRPASPPSSPAARKASGKCKKSPKKKVIKKALKPAKDPNVPVQTPVGVKTKKRTLGAQLTSKERRMKTHKEDQAAQWLLLCQQGRKKLDEGDLLSMEGGEMSATMLKMKKMQDDVNFWMLCLGSVGALLPDSQKLEEQTATNVVTL